MSFVRILVHTVWTTKNRIPYLNDNLREDVIQHIRQNAIKKRIFIDHINGGKEHLHALISLSKNQNIAEIMQHLKGDATLYSRALAQLKKKGLKALLGRGIS